MNVASLMAWLDNFEVRRVKEYFVALKLEEGLQNPYILVGIGIVAIVALFLKWRILLVTILTITGFVALFNYVNQRGTSLTEFGSESMAIFLGGGVVIVGLVIYALFIKGE